MTSGNCFLWSTRLSYSLVVATKQHSPAMSFFIRTRHFFVRTHGALMLLQAHRYRWPHGIHAVPPRAIHCCSSHHNLAGVLSSLIRTSTGGTLRRHYTSTPLDAPPVFSFGYRLRAKPSPQASQAVPKMPVPICTQFCRTTSLADKGIRCGRLESMRWGLHFHLHSLSRAPLSRRRIYIFTRRFFFVCQGRFHTPRIHGSGALAWSSILPGHVFSDHSNKPIITVQCWESSGWLCTSLLLRLSFPIPIPSVKSNFYISDSGCPET
ncbi:hypothetical protein F5146DRAFT_492452 [Armillaria mellea]|nr:hypothetical protein F5146DRAFT_492452 [Armillaria mellea]